MPPIPQNFQLPYVARLAFALISITILVYWMYVLDSIITLLLFSVIISIALYPLTAWLEQKGFPRMLAITVSILAFSLVAAGIATLLVYQVTDFTTMLPQLIQKINASLNKLQLWAYDRFNIPPSRQLKEIQKYYQNMAEGGGELVGTAVTTTTSMLGNLSILPVYIFFLLYYRDMFRQFFCKVFVSAKKTQVHEVLDKIYEVVHSYLSGLFIVTLIVGTLNSVGLLILGIPSAIFFGFLAAMLLIIPYIGILIGSVLPIVVALVTKDSPMYALGVAGIFFFVQMLEGNVITPYIVGSKISVNPLVAIVGLFLGGSLWGIAGLALALPLTAIIKVVFDAVDYLKPYGYLMGEPEISKERAVKSRKVQQIEREVVDTITDTTNEVKSLFKKKRTGKSTV
ncbi:AI-2E family transporter [Runella aurantiaca]|uniref:AI-2E family transporter n=1 Tax=Runella aurantiaca TaxID=2282308 RepID=A0A369I1I4_9BACT|nr:AI-2E family transporter [Runella aurantiaca]RDB03629.1 AI-2E family transporter [Runella aurantiaca]